MLSTNAHPPTLPCSGVMSPTLTPPLMQPELQLNFPEWQAAGTFDEFRLHEAALEWSLADPIIIGGPEDIRSTVNWQDRLKPFKHQIQNLMTFCRRLPVTLLADDVGLGKTISAGLILSELIVRSRVRRALVICPSILGPQWIDELESKFGIIGRLAKGAELDRELKSECPVVVTTYHSISPRMEKILPGQFDMMILDEAHKLRNLHGTQKSPKFPQQIRAALEGGLFTYVLMLTATPIQNRLWDLYSLVDCLAVARGRANPFGKPKEFSTNFIADPSKGARKLRPQSARQFRQILSQYLVRTRRNDVRLLFPKRKVVLRRVKPSNLDVQLQALVAANIRGLNGLQQSSLAQAMMSSPQALVAQLRNMAQRDEKWKALATEVEDLAARESLPSKAQGLLDLVEELRSRRPKDWRLVVFTIRLETLRMICDVLRRSNVPFGTIHGGAAAQNLTTVKQFTAEMPAIHVIVSTDAGAEGLNLQAGNVVVNYDLPWNPMIVEQRIGRVQRLASKHGHVAIINLAVANSPEERVVVRLIEKLQTIVESVGDIEVILGGSDDGDDADSSFETTIRNLVIKSLAGQDVGLATALQVRSIDEAKTLFEQQRNEIDETLGRLDAEHRAGPSVPKLTRIKPSQDSDSFTQEALQAEGYRLSLDPNGCLRADRPRQASEFVTFSEPYWRQNSQSGVFMGKRLFLYRPGQPPFEKLVQRWLDRGAQAIVDGFAITDVEASNVADEWVQTRIDGAFMESLKILERAPVFQGRCRFKATASNGVDSYETLLDVEHVPDGHERVYAMDSLAPLPLVSAKVRPQALIGDLPRRAEEECRQNSDIQAFRCFYEQRLDEEVTKTGGDAERERKVRKDFQPILHAEAVALTGLQYEICRVLVALRIDGHEGYDVTLELCPATRQILDEPSSWRSCEETGRKVPINFLEECSISRKSVRRHLLVVSDESGRKALRQYAVVCPLTGKTALSDEFLISDISGARGIASQFSRSESSGRVGLPDEFRICDFTGAKVLVDEILVSDVSQKNYRNDQSSSSTVSGKSGHVSEFVTCEFTGLHVLSEETVISDLSQKRMSANYATHSERPPHRVGGPGETAICEFSGKSLLLDEVGKCEATDKLADTELLSPSKSGRLAHKDQLVTCEFSGDRLIPDEAIISDVSAKLISRQHAQHSARSPHRVVAPNELVVCEFSGRKLLPDEVARCEATGKLSDTEFLHQSKSGRLAHKDQLVTCEFSGDRLMPDEAVRSAVSDKCLTQRLACRSMRPPHRIGGPTETVSCEFSGQTLLQDEVGKCEATGKLADTESLSPSKSGRLAHKDQLVTCEFSGDRLIPDEAIISDVSAKLISRQHAIQSPVSGKSASRDECVRCEFSKAMVLPDELIKSDVSSHWFRRDQSVRSAISGRIGHGSESVTCEFTWRSLLSDEAGQSDFSGKWAARTALQSSAKSKRLGVPSEFVLCVETGSALLKDEVGTSTVSGLVVDCDLLKWSTVSNRLALSRELITCEVSQALLCPDEVGVSVVSGRKVNRQLLVASNISKQLALPDEMLQCAVTGKKCLPSEVEQCALSGKRVVPNELETCVVTGKRALRGLLLCSSKSERWMVPSKAISDFRTGKPLCPDETAYCHWNDAYLFKGDAAKCRRTGVTFVKELLSSRGDFKGFPKLFSGDAFDGEESFDGGKFIPWLKKQLDGKLKASKIVWFFKSKQNKHLFMEIDLQPNLGLWGDYRAVAVVEFEKTSPKRILGRVTRRTNETTPWAEL